MTDISRKALPDHSGSKNAADMTHVEQGPHQGQKVYTAGEPLENASSAMILVHGRGATAPSILELSGAFPIAGMIYLAPQAMGNTWYPFSFLAARHQNEPGISSGLAAIKDVIDRVVDAGIPLDRVVLAGFSGSLSRFRVCCQASGPLRRIAGFQWRVDRASGCAAIIQGGSENDTGFSGVLGHGLPHSARTGRGICQGLRRDGSSRNKKDLPRDGPYDHSG